MRDEKLEKFMSEGDVSIFIFTLNLFGSLSTSGYSYI